MGGNNRKRGGRGAPSSSSSRNTNNGNDNSDKTSKDDAATDEKVFKENEQSSNAKSPKSQESPSSSTLKHSSKKTNTRNESKPSASRRHHKRGAKPKNSPGNKKETIANHANPSTDSNMNGHKDPVESIDGLPSSAQDDRRDENGVDAVRPPTATSNETSKNLETPTKIESGDENAEVFYDSNEKPGNEEPEALPQTDQDVHEQNGNGDAPPVASDLRGAPHGDPKAALTPIRGQIEDEEKPGEPDDTKVSSPPRQELDNHQNYIPPRRTSQGDMEAFSPYRNGSNGNGADQYTIESSNASTSSQERSLRRASHGDFEASSPTRPGATTTSSTQRSPMADAVSRVQQELSSIPEALPTIPSLSDCLHRKAGIASFGAWAKLSLTLDGRDKITKVLQYASRFLAWWYLGTSRQHQVKRFENLKKSLGSSRKAFRLGRTLIELQRLQKMGLLEILFWHWRRSASGDESDPDESQSSEPPKHNNPKALLRRISTNIGLNYSQSQETIFDILQTSPSLFRRASQLPSRLYKMSTGLTLRDNDDEKQTPIALALLSAVKVFGLALYFTGDNISYLSSIGLCDNFQIKDESVRLANRKRLTTAAAKYGNRAYFAASLAGLLVSWKNYWNYVESANKRLNEEDDGSTSECDHDKAKEKQFKLFLSLVKSCCDVLVFSNNPGIDLWKNGLGFPLNEAVHCSAGLVSAATVLCNNFPNN